jgi:hypothetical protein
MQDALSAHSAIEERFFGQLFPWPQPTIDPLVANPCYRRLEREEQPVGNAEGPF